MDGGDVVGYVGFFSAWLDRWILLALERSDGVVIVGTLDVEVPYITIFVQLDVLLLYVVGVLLSLSYSLTLSHTHTHIYIYIYILARKSKHRRLLR